MRITDLLDKRSISLDGAPKNKQEALDMAIDMGGPFNKSGIRIRHSSNRSR